MTCRAAFVLALAAVAGPFSGTQRTPPAAPDQRPPVTFKVQVDIKDVVVPDRVTITRDVRGVQEAMRDAVSAATRGNVSIYSIDPRGLSTGMEEAIRSPTILDAPGRALGSREFIDEMSRSHLSMRALSEQTGGIAFLNTNDTTAPLSRIIEDSSRYYGLGYSPRSTTTTSARPIASRRKQPSPQRAARSYSARRTNAGATNSSRTAVESARFRAHGGTRPPFRFRRSAPGGTCCASRERSCRRGPPRQWSANWSFAFDK